jgi:hypothetical protein
MMTPQYKQRLMDKLVSLFVSFKVHLCALATVLLFLGKINEQTWSTVVLGIALGRVMIQGVATYKNIKLDETER